MNKNILLIIVILIAVGLIASAIIKLSNHPAANTNNLVVKPVPISITNSQSTADLKLTNGQLDYNELNYRVGETITLNMFNGDQPVEFRLQEVPSVQSTEGRLKTDIPPLNQPGTYHLVCRDKGCGVITVTITSGQ